MGWKRADGEELKRLARVTLESEFGALGWAGEGNGEGRRLMKSTELVEKENSSENR